jgi:hypothetical protein
VPTVEALAGIRWILEVRGEEKQLVPHHFSKLLKYLQAGI